jgi:hypothetical protein
MKVEAEGGECRFDALPVAHAMRAPTFEEARFRLDTALHAISIKVHY